MRERRGGGAREERGKKTFREAGWKLASVPWVWWEKKREDGMVEGAPGGGGG